MHPTRRGRSALAGLLSTTALLGGLLLPAATAAAAPVTAQEIGSGTALIPGEYVLATNGTSFRIAGREDTPGAPDSWTAEPRIDLLTQCFLPDGGDVAWLAIIEREGGGDLGGQVTRLGLFDRTHLLAAFTSDELRQCLGTQDIPLPTDRYHLVGVEWRDLNPAGVRAADGTYDLFSGDWVADRQYVPGRGWQPAAMLSGGLTPYGASALRLPNGSARVFMTGADKKLYYGDVTTGRRRFLGWTSAGGSLTGRPYPVLLPDHSVAVFGQSTRGELVEALWRSTGVFQWIHLGGPAECGGATGPTAASTGSGRITVVVCSGARSVATRSFSPAGGWGGWRQISGEASRNLSSASPAAGVFDLYVGGFTNGRAMPLYTRRAVNGVWGRWTNLGGSIAPNSSGPFAAASGVRTDVWVQGADGNLYQRARTGSGIGPWVRLPTARP